MSIKEQLLEELKKEYELIDCLQKSIEEWKTTEPEPTTGKHDEDHNADEDSEWRVRFETQRDINSKLMGQLSALKERVTKEKKKLKTLAQGGEVEELGRFKGANAKKTLIKMEREKLNLESQLRDYEWRLDQEAEAFQRAEEKRNALMKDMAKATGRSPSRAGKKSTGKRPAPEPPRRSMDKAEPGKMGRQPQRKLSNVAEID